jgi:hypothetical protein
MPSYTPRPTCSTNAPKRRRSTGATHAARSTAMFATFIQSRWLAQARAIWSAFPKRQRTDPRGALDVAHPKLGRGARPVQCAGCADSLRPEVLDVEDLEADVRTKSAMVRVNPEPSQLGSEREPAVARSVVRASTAGIHTSGYFRKCPLTGDLEQLRLRVAPHQPVDGPRSSATCSGSAAFSEQSSHGGAARDSIGAGAGHVRTLDHGDRHPQQHSTLQPSSTLYRGW